MEKKVKDRREWMHIYVFSVSFVSLREKTDVILRNKQGKTKKWENIFAVVFKVELLLTVCE